MGIFLCIFCCLYILCIIPACLCFYHLLPSTKRGDMYMLLQNTMESLRPLVGSKGWDFCVLWKLSEDQRFVEWMNCCCGGAETSQEANNNNNNSNSNSNCGDEELLFPVSPLIPCRDTMFQHPRTNSCDLLFQLPTSMPLDSGIYAQTLISNQPSWLNSSSVTGSHFLEECIGTRVLIPLAGGLVELFVNKQIPEDPNVIDFVTSQCNVSPPLEHHHQNDNTTTSFVIDMNDQIIQSSRPFMMSESDKTVDHAEGNPPVSPATAFEGLNLSAYDMPVQFGARNDASFLEGEENGKGGKRGSNSMSDCSDQIEEDENEGNNNKHLGSRKSSSGKGPQSKNLVAERKRRKKLNERLYTLRSLVPNISKLDRASILGDAIEYVKDLKRQEKELQDELEEHSENDATNGKRNNPTSEILNFGANSESPNDFSFENNEITLSKQNLDSETVANNDKAPQMEPQVEVAQIEGNEFFVKVFCEHKPGRFVRLLEALNSLALEVTNANVTTFRNLVSNVLKVEKKDSRMVVQADNLRDLLLEFTRNPSRGLCDISKPLENGTLLDYQLQQHHHHQQT